MMTERTIRSLAKELAGHYYHDAERSTEFRERFPTFRHYMRGQWIMPNGEVWITKPGWVYFIDLARKQLLRMLEREDVSPHLKEAIYDAIIEEYHKATSPNAAKSLQRIERPN